MSQNDESREAFEKWAISLGYDIKRLSSGGTLASNSARNAELGWQACEARMHGRMQELIESAESLRTRFINSLGCIRIVDADEVLARFDKALARFTTKQKAL